MCRDRFASKNGKIEVLRNYWDKTLSRLMKRAAELSDKPMKNLIAKLQCNIPDETRTKVLSLWVSSCHSLNQIAFFQWRKRYKSKYRYDVKEIEELIDFRIQFQFQRNLIDQFAVPRQKTL